MESSLLGSTAGSCPLVQSQESSDVYSLELVLCADGVQGVLGPLHEVLV